MRDGLTRRKVLATSTASLGAFGIGSSIVSADDCQKPDWIKDSGLDRDDLRNYGPEIVDMETDNAQWIYSATCMLPMYTNSLGDEIFHGVTAAYNFDNCGTGNQDAMIKGHGSRIDVKEGSLFASVDPGKMAVWPNTAGEAKDEKLENKIGFTALKGALGLANPEVGAAILAADLMETAISTLGYSDGDENSHEYAWGHSNNEWLNDIYHNVAGHAVEFLIDPNGSSTIEFDMHHYVASNDKDFYDKRFATPMFEMENTYKMKSGYGMWGQKASQKVEKVDEEEIERVGLPEEFAKHRPIYKTIPEDASLQSVEE